jgi:hypothetical protein
MTYPCETETCQTMLVSRKTFDTFASAFGLTRTNRERSALAVMPATAPEPRANHGPATREVVSVPIMSIQPGDSPRLDGEDKAHIERLAETEAELPPILVDAR